MANKLARPWELKDIDSKGRFVGMGSVFGELDSHFDVVMPGAFKDTLADYEAKGRKVPVLWQHDMRSPIGVYDTIKETKDGLYVEGQLVMEVQQAKEAHALMDAGALTGLSIGYKAVKYDYNDAGVRLLHSLKLFEVSPVTFPSGDSARISSVKTIEAFTSLSECEDWLRDAAGCSRKAAQAFIARVKASSPSDSGGADAAKLSELKKLIDSIQIPSIR